MYHPTCNPSVLTNEDIVKCASAAGATQPHQDVSDKYSFVPTLQAVALLRSDGWLPVSARQSATRNDDRRGFQKHTIRFMKDGLVFSDQERVDLLMVNSHDRGCAFHLMASVWRKICGNGLMVSTDLVNFSHKHINFDADAFVNSAKLIAGHAGKVAGQVETYKAIELEPNEKGIYAAAAHQLVYEDPDEAPIRPEQLLQERRYDDRGDDLWTVYNVLQENILKGGIRGRKRGANNRIRRVTTRAVKSIDRDVRLNKALWTLTEKMAELKAAD
jgi:hypothetical protein